MVALQYSLSQTVRGAVNVFLNLRQGWQNLPTHSPDLPVPLYPQLTFPRIERSGKIRHWGSSSSSSEDNDRIILCWEERRSVSVLSSGRVEWPSGDARATIMNR